MGCEPALPLAPNSGGVSKVSQGRCLLQDGVQPPLCLRLPTSLLPHTFSSRGRAALCKEERISIYYTSLLHSPKSHNTV